MERFHIPQSNLNPNFIGSWIIRPKSVCDDLMDYFESNIGKQKKGVSKGGVNSETKDSVDITINPKDILIPGNEIFKVYFEKLFECHQDYIAQWPFLEGFCERYEIGSFNLQRYNPGQHFKKIHTERSSLGTLHRIFVFMTYLNDVKDGGSTYFKHYDLEIEPKQGLTLIWPAEWTHAHRGNIINSDSKYIITGWINFCN